MDVAALLKRMEEQRAHWVDLPGGRRLQFLRPPEVDLPTLMGGVRLEHIVRYACGWAGFTEACLLGPADGAADSVPFARPLLEAWLADNSDALVPVAQAMAAAVDAHLKKRAATGKN